MFEDLYGKKGVPSTTPKKGALFSDLFPEPVAPTYPLTAKGEVPLMPSGKPIPIPTVAEPKGVSVTLTDDLKGLKIVDTGEIITRDKFTPEIKQVHTDLLKQYTQFQAEETKKIPTSWLGVAKEQLKPVVGAIKAIPSTIKEYLSPETLKQLPSEFTDPTSFTREYIRSLPKATTNVLYGFVMGLAETPFKVAKGLGIPGIPETVPDPLYSILKKVGKEDWVSMYKTVDIGKSYQDRYRTEVAQETDPIMIAGKAIRLGSDVILDVAIVGGLVEGITKELAKYATPTTISVQEARNTLGVEPGASKEEIKQTFFDLAHETHPDTLNGSDEAFKKINDAYQTLTKERSALMRVGDVAKMLNTPIEQLMGKGVIPPLPAGLLAPPGMEEPAPIVPTEAPIIIPPTEKVSPDFQRALTYLQEDGAKQMAKFSVEGARIWSSVDISKAKTIDEAKSIIEKALPTDIKKIPSVAMTLENFPEAAKRLLGEEAPEVPVGKKEAKLPPQLYKWTGARTEGTAWNALTESVRSQIGETVGEAYYYSLDPISSQKFGKNISISKTPKNLKIFDSTQGLPKTDDTISQLQAVPEYREMLKANETDFLKFMQDKGYQGIVFFADDGKSKWLALPKPAEEMKAGVPTKITPIAKKALFGELFPEKGVITPPVVAKKPAVPRAKAIPEYWDEIDMLVHGKTKLALPSKDVKVDWRESIGTDSYMRIFSGGKTAETPDEFAERLGLSESELITKVSDRLAHPTPVSTVDELVDDYVKQVSKDLKAQAQKGFIRIPPTEVLETPEGKVAQILKTTKTPQSVFSDIAKSIDSTKYNLEKIFSFRPGVKNYPAYRNDVRLFIDSPREARQKADLAIYGIIGNLNTEEYNLFKSIVALEDLKQTASQGLKIPRGITLEEVETELTRLKKSAPETVKEAVKKHFDYMEAMGKDLVERGKLEAVREKYYPHRVLDYEPVWGDWVGISRKIRTPYRPYTKTRVGSIRDIDMDYLKVMKNHLAKVYLDNITDDWIASEMVKWDLGLTDEQKLDLFGKSKKPLPNHIYTVEGKDYLAFQPQPGNYLYPASTINESLFNIAVESNLTASEFGQVTGVRGGKAIGEAGALGRKRKTYLVPKEIAEDLLRFKVPAGDLSFLYQAIQATSLWKRIVIDFAGVPFQIKNMFGDLINLYKTDPGALKNVPKALYLVFKDPAKLSPDERNMIKQALEQRVTSTFLLREAGVLPEADILEKFRSPLVRYNPANFVLELWENVSSKLEAGRRLASFMTNLDRIDKGEQIVSGEVDVTGLDNIAAAGKVAREFTVDYGAVSEPYRRMLRGMLTPFITFYDYNARNWYKYATKKPLDFFLKFVTVIVAMWAWNNTGKRKEIEENLPDYYMVMPHIITGYNTKDGKPIIIALDTPVDLAMRWFGLDRITANLTRYRAGDMTAKEAVIKQAEDIVLGFPRMVHSLLSPFLRATEGLLANKDPFYGTTVVPDNLKGTPEEKKLIAEYLLSNFFSPYMQYQKALRMLEPGDTWAKWLQGGIFDFERAFGIREIDLERGKEQRVYLQQAEMQAKVNEILFLMEKGWVKWQGTGDKSDYDKAVKYLLDSPIRPTAEQIENRLIDWNTLSDITKERMKRTPKTDPKYQEYQDQLKFINQVKFITAKVAAPKAIREEVFKEIQRIYGE
jgi:hypothetical protein